MATKKITIIKWALPILLLTIMSSSFAWVYFQNDSAIELSRILKSEENKEVDEKAEKILKDMSNSLKSLKEFSVKSKGYFEIVDSTGKKEKMNNSAEAFIKRPDKIKVERTGEKSDIEFYCNGKEVTLYGKKVNYYATAPAASNLNQTFDKISENLGIYLPGMDLLYTDVYEGLMQDVISGKHVGQSKVNNVKCDHLSFTGNEVDWQIWIEEGGKKLPRKYQIISKNIEGKPESVVEITEWKTDVKLDDKLFTFMPPKAAQKIEFLQPKTDPQTKNK